MSKPKVIAIVGPTASGKTALSIDIATQFQGEVISADSRQVYRGLDIGSGKVTKEEMQGIPHHLLDVADITTVYSGADFVRDAGLAIEDIIARGKVPIIVGGTYFYIALLQGTVQSAPVPPNPALRAELETIPTETLYARLQQLDPERALTIDPHNRRRLIRSLEIIAALGSVPTPTTRSSSYEWLTIGVDVPKDQLHHNIDTRLHTRLEHGMIEEVSDLLASGIPATRLYDLGLEYRYLTLYLQHEISYDEMVREIQHKSRQFAKRQLTWLKRNRTIEWYPADARKAIHDRICTFLTNELRKEDNLIQ